MDLQLAQPGYNGVPWRVFARYQGQAIEHTKRYNPWEDWAVGGPLLEEHMVSLHCPQSTDDVWAGWVMTDQGEYCQAGNNALIAASRAIVAAKFGDTVQVPKELLS